MEEDLGEEVTYDVNNHSHCDFFFLCILLLLWYNMQTQKPPGLHSSSFSVVLSLSFNVCPPGGAVYQVWNACAAEFHNQTEGGGGQRGAETQEKVQEEYSLYDKMIIYSVTDDLVILCLFF